MCVGVASWSAPQDLIICTTFPCIRINSVNILAQLEVRGGVLRGQCRYQTPHPQRCATTAFRAKADAMALWDDDPDPKPAPVPLVSTVSTIWSAWGACGGFEAAWGVRCAWK